MITAKTVPTFYFIGVTTGRSSIMRVFPLWMQALGRPDVVLEGVDLKLHDDPARYRQAVAQIKQDSLSLGALVTTHKIDLLDAARDMFDTLDPYARLCGEVSCISKHEGRLEGYIGWAEMAKYEYDLNDRRLNRPVYREYRTPLKKCDDRSISGPPASDVAGCMPVDTTAGESLIYTPFQVGGGLQHLLDLIVSQGYEVEVQKDRLDDRPVYRLAFTWEHLVPGVHGSTPSIYVNTTVLYIDRETYRLVKTELQNRQREAVHTTLILEYEILNPQDLDFDPFAWPPAR